MSILANWKAEGTLSESVFEKLTIFSELLLRWNPRINLTGLRTRNEIEEVLIVESILTLRAFPMSAKTVLDFGSGAGIPGLVWVMCDSSIRLTSLEIRAKKAAFQKEVARHTGISAEILCGRFPEAVAGREFDVIATRAIRFDPKLWMRAAELLSPGGALIRFASADAGQEGWMSLTISPRTTLLVHTPLDPTPKSS